MSRLKQIQEMAHSFNEIGAVSDETVNRLDGALKPRRTVKITPNLPVTGHKVMFAFHRTSGTWGYDSSILKHE